MELDDLSPTDASNVTQFPENQAPSTLNDGARALQGMIARYTQDIDTSLEATLSGSVIQVTANRNSITLTGTASNYRAGLMIGWTMGSVPNTGAVSLSIDGIGPISLRDNGGASLSSSVLLAGMRCKAVKDDANNYFRLLIPSVGLRLSAEAQGDLAIRGAAVWQSLAIGTAGQMLAVNSGADAPEWVSKATQSDQETGTSTTAPITPAVQQHHPSAAKFWIKANPVGGINASYNVASVTDVGTGLIDIVIGTDFSSAHWACMISLEPLSPNINAIGAVTPGNQTAGAVRVESRNTGNAVLSDPTSYYVVGFGDQA